MNKRHAFFFFLALTCLKDSDVQATATPDPRFGQGGIADSNPTAPPGCTPDAMLDTFDGLIDHAGRYVSAYSLGMPELIESSHSVACAGVIVRQVGGGVHDTTFGDSGYAYWTYAGMRTAWTAMKEDLAGKLVVAGYVLITADDDTSRQGVVCRFQENGEIDSGFGVQGCTVLPHPSSLNYTAVVDLDVRDDGSIVALLLAYGSSPFLVAGLTNDGAIDTSFGDLNCAPCGFARSPPFYGKIPAPIALTINRKDSGILVASTFGSPFNKAGLIKFDKTGKVDGGFGSGGAILANFSPAFAGEPATSVAADVAVGPTGDVFLAATTRATDSEGVQADHVGIAAFGPAGTMKSGYGITGVNVAKLTQARGAKAGHLTLQEGGRALVAGLAIGIDSMQSCGVVRFDPTGHVDIPFGGSEFYGAAVNFDGAISEGINGIDVNTAVAVDGTGVVLFDRRFTDWMNIYASRPIAIRLEVDRIFSDSLE